MSEVEIFEGHGGEQERLFIEALLREQGIPFVMKTGGAAEEYLGDEPYRIFVMSDDVDRALLVLDDVQATEVTDFVEEEEEDPWGQPFAEEEEEEYESSSGVIGDTGVPIAAPRNRFAMWLGLLALGVGAVLFFQFDDPVLALIPAILGGWLVAAYLRS